MEGVSTIVQSQLPFGTFFRPLAPGKHKVRASAPGYASSVVDVEVPADGKGAYVEIVLSKGVTPEQLLQRDPQSNGVDGIVPGLIKAQRLAFQVDQSGPGYRPVILVAGLGFGFWALWVVGWRVTKTRHRRKLVSSRPSVSPLRT